MNTHTATQIQKTIQLLRASLLTVINHVDDLVDLVDRLPGSGAPAAPATVADPGSSLRLDRATYTVRWEDQACFLGYTMAFRVLERLARRPNEFVATDRLLDELWAGRRTPSTVRSTVWGLRVKLRAAGMDDLAEMIDGRNPGHYGLMISRR